MSFLAVIFCIWAQILDLYFGIANSQVEHYARYIIHFSHPHNTHLMARDPAGTSKVWLLILNVGMTLLLPPPYGIIVKEHKLGLCWVY